MTQNDRKEPSFGDLTTDNTSTDSIEKAETTEKVATPYVSLHSNQAPGHTFTPIMKRPEEQQTTESQTAKEFAFTPSADSQEAMTTSEELTQPEVFEEVSKTEPVIIQPASDGFTTERVIPAAATAATAATIAAATTERKSKPQLPAKTRRLLLVGLLVLALLVLFFLLKPSTPETVEELQSQQGSSLPIEFRPVDEEEAKRAEEQARAEQEAAAAKQLEEQQAQTAAQQTSAAPTNTPAVVEPVQNTQPTVTATNEPVAAKPVEAKPVAKPQTQGSVVYQPETTQKSQPKPQPKVEKLTPQPQKEPAKVVAKPAEKATAKVAETAKATAETASIKTMTVPKGVSLMQVFRDNNLNISDVNAMSKVNNIVSNLKVGERVTVRLDNNNRVVEMSIGSGGKFTRQANGSYTFK